MDCFVSLCKKFMKSGAHDHTFCSALQSSQWYQRLVTEKVDGVEVDESMTDDVEMESASATDFCSIQPIPLLYSDVSGI